MSQQLGENYRNTFSVSALPAFLSVAEHLVPSSDNAKRRSKLLENSIPKMCWKKPVLKAS
jgi:hypothetical protein